MCFVKGKTSPQSPVLWKHDSRTGGLTELADQRSDRYLLMRQTEVTAANTDLAPESEFTSHTNIFENEVIKNL